MNKSMLKELPQLVNAGVITQETAERIILHYKQEKQTAPNNLTIILGILGALLAGSGILLIVAHNWDDLSVTIKTALAFLPLLLAQLACAYTLSQRRSDTTWRECSSLFLFFAIGASISLISQIYQVNGSLSGFLLIWMLLALPLVYLLSARTVALFCIAGITWYATDIGYDRYGSIPFMYLLVLAVLIPHYYKLYKKNPEGNFYHLFNWFTAISVAITLGCFANHDEHVEEWLFLQYCLLFCIYYFLGRTSFFQSKNLFANPFLIIGTLGIITTLLFWSFSFIWNEDKIPGADQVYNNLLFYLMGAGLILLAFMAWKNYVRQKEQMPDPIGYSFIVLLLLLVFMQNAISTAIFIVNAWTVLIGIYFIQKGAVKNHLGIVNLGLTIIASLAICRFFDDRIPFVWRGIFFLATGIAFFVANYLLIRKRKQQVTLQNNDQP
ncbi:MAG: DUF2157 domain-containing protein [Chitinophagaceae bacterium]